MSKRQFGMDHRAGRICKRSCENHLTALMIGNWLINGQRWRKSVFCVWQRCESQIRYGKQTCCGTVCSSANCCAVIILPDRDGVYICFAIARRAVFAYDLEILHIAIWNIVSIHSKCELSIVVCRNPARCWIRTTRARNLWVTGDIKSFIITIINRAGRISLREPVVPILVAAGNLRCPTRANDRKRLLSGR